MKIFFKSKWSDEEIKELSLNSPSDVNEYLVSVKDRQLENICEKLILVDAYRPTCCMTKVVDSDNLLDCEFYHSLTDLLIREYNSGADFKFVYSGNKIRKLQLIYADKKRISIYPFSPYGLNMYRVMLYGIVNTDPIVKKKYIFEKVWENRWSYLLDPKYLVKGLEKV